MRGREARRCAPPPFIPAEAGIQSQALELRDSGSPLSRGRTGGARNRDGSPSIPRRRRAALILPAWVSNCAAVLRRGSIPSCLRAPVPPEARSGPFPARLAGGVAIWCRRPNACTLARTRGILWGMRPWRALRGGQAGARPVSQPPAPACELPVIKVKISHWRRLR